LLALVHPVISAMSTPAEAVDGTAAYLTICFIGIPFITAYNIISSIFRGMGDSKSPMYFIAVACAANIGLDYLFMGVFRLGPAGAALGTTLSQAISVAVSLTVILKRKSIVLKKDDFRPLRPVMGNILKIGVPIAFQDGLIQIAFIVITIIANRRGLNDAAAVGIVEKVMSFLFLVPSSMLSTVSALGAQNIGAGKPERAIQTLRYAVMLAAGFGILASITIQFTAESVVAMFTDQTTADGAQVVRFGGQYLRGYIFDCIFAGIHFSFSGYFCACGKSGLSFLHNILAIVLVRIPGVYLASQLFPSTLFPMGLATATGSLLSVVICVVAFTIIRRKERQLVLKM
jgi:putative MATE family efflux protein